MKKENIFIKKPSFYVLFSAIVILFTSWTVYYKLPHSFWLILCFSIWTFVKYNHLLLIKGNLVISFFVISIWFYIPFKFTITSLIVGLASSLSLSLIFCIDKKTTTRILDCLFSIIAGLVVLGLVFHLMRFLNIYDSPRIAVLERGDGRVYAVYLFHVYEQISSGNFLYYRFYSIFDEPGYLGTITALYLIYQKFNFKKNRNIILFIGGIFTLSLAFYILTVPYLLLKLNKNRKGPLLALSIGILIVLSFSDNSNIIFLTRTEFSSVDFASSRGDLNITMENLKFIQNQDLLPLLFGNGHDAHLYVNQYQLEEGAGVTNSSIFRLFHQIGVLGVIYLIAFVFVNIKKDNSGIHFAVAFIISLIQRPQVFESIFVLLLAVNSKVVLDNHIQKQKLRKDAIKIRKELR
jgi:hypothetical protein